VHDDKFAGSSEFGTGFDAKFRLILREWLVHIAVDEVMHHFDGASYAEVRFRDFLEIAGDAGDSIALLDGVAGNWQVGPVHSYQGDIGAVQRGYKRQMLAALGQHLARQQRAHGVGNRVVDMEQIEQIVLGYLSHARGESEIVGWKLEEGIIRDGNFVVEDSGFAAGKSKRLRIADEVNFMAESRKLDAEFGSDHSAAAVGGVTRNSDAHKPSEDKTVLNPAWTPTSRQ